MEVFTPAPFPAEAVRQLAKQKAAELGLEHLLLPDNWANPHLANDLSHTVLQTRNSYDYL